VGAASIIGKTLAFMDGSDAHTFSWSDIQYPPARSLLDENFCELRTLGQTLKVVNEQIV